MDYFPLFHDFKHKPCLIVGGGDIALRKTQLILRAGANITLVAPDISDELKSLLNQSQHQLVHRKFSDDDVLDKTLVIAATDNEAVNQQVSMAARKHRCLVNVVDSPKLSDVIVPAIIDRDPIIVAVSSGGKAPVLARQLRTKIETLVPASYGALASLAGKFRDKVKTVFKTTQDRRYFWESVFEGLPAEMAMRGDEAGAEKIINEQLDQAKTESKNGEVYLVGAGPGDPDLLTFKALRLMQRADIVLYDRLVSKGVMELVRRDAEKIYVGKQRSEHAVQQLKINQLLVDYAKQGKRVLRLKGGDPFIFGRGGEEIELLAEQGIPFQVVPGITAASGCASYAGIPLTHRDYAQSVRFITGHLKSNQCNLEFPELLDPRQTLVFYMGLVGLPEICQKLIQHGRSPDTPIALIEKGTTDEQRVLTSTIAKMPSDIADKDIHAPTLIIVGDVVKLQSKLSWFRK